jgi:DMSO/TMAO reductase YedYZ molybdopterin-dependent catalytic subunit
VRRRTLLLIPVLAAILAGCESPGAAAVPVTTAPATGPTAATLPAGVPPAPTDDCAPPITPPTLPEVVPGYLEVDPATGLHVTGTPVELDVASYRLEVTGLVDYPLRLTYDELRCLPRVELATSLICPNTFIDEASWTGVPLRAVLQLAGIQEAATQVRLVAADGYAQSLDLTPDTLVSAFLAYEVDGATLPVLHGFPLRLVWPDHSGFEWIKWIVAIEVS